MLKRILAGIAILSVVGGTIFIYKNRNIKKPSEVVKESEKTNSEWAEYKNDKQKINVIIPKGWAAADMEGKNGMDLWAVFTPSSPSGTISQVSLAIGGNNKELSTQKEFDEWLAKDERTQKSDTEMKIMNNDVAGEKGMTWYSTGNDPDLGKYWQITTWWRKAEKNYYFTTLGKEKDSDFEIQLHLNMLDGISYLK